MALLCRRTPVRRALRLAPVLVTALLAGQLVAASGAAADPLIEYLFNTAALVASGADVPQYPTGGQHDVDVDGSTVRVVYASGSAIFLATSTDGGLTFGSPQQVSADDGGTYEAPTIARRGTTTVIAWDSFGTSNKVWATSESDGSTWSTPTEVADAQSSQIQGVSVALSSTGVAYLAMDLGGNTYVGCLAGTTAASTLLGGQQSPAGGGGSVTVTPSDLVVIPTDDGNVWSQNAGACSGSWGFQSHSDGLFSTRATGVAADAGGTIYVIGDASANFGTYNLEMTTSADGSTFTTAQTVYNSTLHRGYGIAAGAAGHVYITLFDANGRFAYTNDGGTTWDYVGGSEFAGNYQTPSEEAYNDQSCTTNPTPATGPGDTVYVTWVSPGYCNNYNVTDVAVACGSLTSACPTAAPPVTPVATVIAHPLVDSIGRLGAAISWTQGSQTASGVRVCWGPSASASPTACANHVDVPNPATSTHISGLTKGVSYTFTVYAVDGSTYADGRAQELVGTAATVAAPHLVVYGNKITVSTTLTSVSAGAPVSSALVSLFSRPAGSTGMWTHVANVATTSTGTASWSGKPTRNTTYEWRYAGHDGVLMSTVSATSDVAVAFKLTVTATHTTIEHGHTVRLYGTVKPDALGKYVYLQAFLNGSWHTTSVKARVEKQQLPNGVTKVGYVLPVKPAQPGKHHYRAHEPASATNAAGHSRTVTLTAT